MATQKKNQSRENMFKRWLGKKGAAEAEATIQALESVLDNAGVEKKELGFNKDVYQSMLKALSKKKGILEDMKTAVDELIAKVSDDAPEGLSNELIATIMGFLSKVDEGEEEPTEEDPTDEIPVPEDEEDEEVMNFAKTLLKENNAMHEDVKALAELVPTFIDMAGTIRTLLPLVESSGKIDKLVEDMAILQKKVSGRPRVASKDNGNLFKDQKVEDQLKEGTEGESTFFGHRIKK